MRIHSDTLGFKHHHAFTEHSLVSYKHYLKLLWSVLDLKLRRGYSLTVHIPYEVQHPEFVGDLQRGLDFIDFGELLNKMFSIRLYWENAPWLVPPKWGLRYEETWWGRIPRDIDLCLDTGHLMLGCKNKNVFYVKLHNLLKRRSKQIKHVHLSENNFKYDQHKHTRKILTERRLRNITRGRTWVWED